MRRRMGPFVVSGVVMVPLLATASALLGVARDAHSAAPAAGGLTMRSIRGKCGMCHRAIAEEWLNSLHAKAFQDTRFLAETQHEKDAEGNCFKCHAPQAVRARGLGQTPGFRTDLREVGVDCAVCHTDLKGKIHAPYRSGESAHEVEADPQHQTEVLCASCHDAFGTVREFKETTFSKQGQTCSTCHMPKVKRPVAEGGKPKMVSSHIWRGGSDPAMLQKAVKLEAAVAPDGTVTAKVTNGGAGHKFPTGIHYREAIVIVTAADASGKELFTKSEMFSDKTKVGGADNRIAPGETRVVTVPTGVTSGLFVARLIYKTMPSTTESEATTVAATTMKL